MGPDALAVHVQDHGGGPRGDQGHDQVAGAGQFGVLHDRQAGEDHVEGAGVQLLVPADLLLPVHDLDHAVVVPGVGLHPEENGAGAAVVVQEGAGLAAVGAIRAELHESPLGVGVDLGPLDRGHGGDLLGELDGDVGREVSEAAGEGQGQDREGDGGGRGGEVRADAASAKGGRVWWFHRLPSLSASSFMVRAVGGVLKQIKDVRIAMP